AFPALCSLRDAKGASGNGLLDLHLRSILLKLPASLDKMPINKLYEQYGEPDREPVVNLNDPTAPTSPLESHFICPDITPDGAKLMLAWNPSQRPGITQVLAADWMTTRALPAYQSRGRTDDA
ncbi:uncharacterized protein PpBr36_10766, partial [Pyricularia pennisetigena]|uniref:uncharacterized protein n=1 Tax=Pyricularia pennisetigena TaxID=1578925 RepID=UPI00114F1D12